VAGRMSTSPSFGFFVEPERADRRFVMTLNLFKLSFSRPHRIESSPPFPLVNADAVDLSPRERPRSVHLFTFPSSLLRLPARAVSSNTLLLRWFFLHHPPVKSTADAPRIVLYLPFFVFPQLSSPDSDRASLYDG